MTFWKGPGWRYHAERQTMADPAQALRDRLEKRVADQTGLTAKFDFTLTFFIPPPDRTPVPPEITTPDLFTPLPSQLGLRLEARKVAPRRS